MSFARAFTGMWLNPSRARSPPARRCVEDCPVCPAGLSESVGRRPGSALLVGYGDAEEAPSVPLSRSVRHDFRLGRQVAAKFLGYGLIIRAAVLGADQSTARLQG